MDMDLQQKLFYLKKHAREVTLLSSANDRIQRLKKFKKVLLAHQDEIRSALAEDLGRHPTETDQVDILTVTQELSHACGNLRSWMRDQRVNSTIALIGTRSFIHHEGKGAVLILSPWNFPFNLSCIPLISAIAAGNTVMIKPSEHAPESARVLEKIIRSAFLENEVDIIQGGADLASGLCQLSWDHIFFTGSTEVGKKVMAAAAQNATPVTLELGGKSPAIVDATANLNKATKYIAWAKCMNAGQTCIAPDLVYVHASVHDQCLEYLSGWIQKFSASGNYSSCIHKAHADRCESMVAEAIAGGARCIPEWQRQGQSIPPVLLTGLKGTEKVCTDEIFAPILPIISYQDTEELIKGLNSGDKPLAMYLFTKSSSFQKAILNRTSCGGVSINTALLHFFNAWLPFGGVGHSGMGRVHGYAGFQTFSNAKSVLKQWVPYSTADLVMPPFRKWQERLIGFFIKWL